MIQLLIFCNYNGNIHQLNETAQQCGADACLILGRCDYMWSIDAKEEMMIVHTFQRLGLQRFNYLLAEEISAGRSLDLEFAVPTFLVPYLNEGEIFGLCQIPKLFVLDNTCSSNDCFSVETNDLSISLTLLSNYTPGSITETTETPQKTNKITLCISKNYSLQDERAFSSVRGSKIGLFLTEKIYSPVLLSPNNILSLVCLDWLLDDGSFSDYPSAECDQHSMRFFAGCAPPSVVSLKVHENKYVDYAVVGVDTVDRLPYAICPGILPQFQQVEEGQFADTGKEAVLNDSMIASILENIATGKAEQQLILSETKSDDFHENEVVPVDNIISSGNNTTTDEHAKVISEALEDISKKEMVPQEAFSIAPDESAVGSQNENCCEEVIAENVSNEISITIDNRETTEVTPIELKPEIQAEIAEPMPQETPTLVRKTSWESPPRTTEPFQTDAPWDHGPSITLSSSPVKGASWSPVHFAAVQQSHQQKQREVGPEQQESSFSQSSKKGQNITEPSPSQAQNDGTEDASLDELYELHQDAMEDAEQDQDETGADNDQGQDSSGTTGGKKRRRRGCRGGRNRRKHLNNPNSTNATLDPHHGRSIMSQNYSQASSSMPLIAREPYSLHHAPSVPSPLRPLQDHHYPYGNNLPRPRPSNSHSHTHNSHRPHHQIPVHVNGYLPPRSLAQSTLKQPYAMQAAHSSHYEPLDSSSHQYYQSHTTNIGGQSHHHTNSYIEQPQQHWKSSHAGESHTRPRTVAPSSRRTLIPVHQGEEDDILALAKWPSSTHLFEESIPTSTPPHSLRSTMSTTRAMQRSNSHLDSPAQLKSPATLSSLSDTPIVSNLDRSDDCFFKIAKPGSRALFEALDMGHSSPQQQSYDDSQSRSYSNPSYMLTQREGTRSRHGQAGQSVDSLWDPMPSVAPSAEESWNYLSNKTNRQQPQLQIPSLNSSWEQLQHSTAITARTGLADPLMRKVNAFEQPTPDLSLIWETNSPDPTSFSLWS